MSAENPNQANDQLLERARHVIRELREKLIATEAAAHPAPIAVIGMGCDFPGVRTDLKAFWKMTVEGRDAVTMVPEDRWDRDELYAAQAPTPGKMNIREAGFLGDVARFDAAFFDIAPVEAARMDPQQRIFLETAWHALEDAGQTRAMLSGSETGVFVGVHSQSMDYYALQAADLEAIDAYAATGTAQDVIAGRLAYWLNLQGPTMAVNTACSSSLVALHLACRSLRAGDCSMAVVGGVNLLLSPATSIAAAQLQMLAADGRCKTFDARADGFGRGEGCGVVVLKSLAAAQRDGDRVLAVIRGTAINQDGRTNGLTAPNGLAQQRLLRKAYEDAGVTPSHVGYLEAHGTGTSLGDPIEVEALAEVLGASDRTFPCVLGSVKANIGHLEGAAGIAGLIKAVLVLQHAYLPPVANLTTISPHLHLEQSGLKILRRGEPWLSNGHRFAGVSSFGWSGTNAHAVLEEAPAVASKTEAMGAPVLIAISAHTPEALQAIANAYADRLEVAEAGELTAISYTSLTRRTHHAQRLTVVGSAGPALAAALRARVAGVATLVTRAESIPPELSRLARQYESGKDVEWTTLFPKAGRVVSLPYFPFQGKSYWLPDSITKPSIPSASTAPDDWFYEVRWIRQPLSPDRRSTVSAGTVFVIVADKTPFASLLASVIRQRGFHAIEIVRGDRHTRLIKDEYALPVASSQAIEKLLHDLRAEGVPSAQVVYLPTEQDATVLAAEALALAQGILRCSMQSAQLWIITQQAQVLPGGSNLRKQVSPNQAALWGFSRVFGLEHPDRAGGTIDMDTADEATASLLVQDILQSEGEDQIAYRDGTRYVARLKREPVPVGVPAFFRENGCYLVTGAFGNIGIQLTEWLAARGARHVILIGRRSPETISNPKLLERLDTLRSHGVKLDMRSCDIGDELSVASLFRDMEQSGLPLYGVLHAAAAMPFSSVQEAKESEIVVAFQAKVEGARLLDRYTRSQPLDFFVLFSSASVSIGSRNASFYAAANSCLNALAMDRRLNGLPALSVEWGLWESSAATQQQELIAASGFVPMSTQKALDALGRLLVCSSDSSPIVAAVDWPTLHPALEMRGKAAFVSELGETISDSLQSNRDSFAESSQANTSVSWTTELRKLAPGERTESLLSYVSAEVKTIFGMTPEEPLDETRGLFQMGMNSLMSVALKKRLEVGVGLKLPGTLTLTYPTVTALADYLYGRIFADEVATISSPPAHDWQSADDDLTSIEAMDTSETDAAIAAELAAIQQKLGVK